MASTCPQRSSRSKTSRLAIATAAETGWPPNVIPCVKDFGSDMNGSATRSETIAAPIGAYEDVSPLAVVMRSGTTLKRSTPK